MKKYVTPYGTLIIDKDRYILEKTYATIENLLSKQDSLFKKIEDIGFEIKDYKMFIRNFYKKRTYTIRVYLDYLFE